MLLHGCSYNESICLTGEMRFTGRSVKVYYHLRSLDTTTRVGQLGKLETYLLIRTSDLYLSLFMPPPPPNQRGGGHIGFDIGIYSMLLLEWVNLANLKHVC